MPSIPGVDGLHSQREELCPQRFGEVIFLEGL